MTTPHVKIIQVSKCNWKIVSANGTVLQKDITISSKSQALEYVKNYISSFQAWTYQVIPLDD